MRAKSVLNAVLVGSLAFATTGQGENRSEAAAPQDMRGGVARKALLFTFDDGPDLEHTPRLLDELERRHVRAMFFVLANKLRAAHPHSQEHGDLVREIHRRGHLVGSHNVVHVRLDRLQLPALNAQLDEGKRLFASLEIGDVIWFRPPHGMTNPAVLDAIGRYGYRPLLWNINPRDYSEPRTEVIVQNFNRQVAYRAARGERGGVVLFHDTLARSREAFVRIHDALIEENCRLSRTDPSAELWDIVGTVEELNATGDVARDRQTRLRTHACER